MEHQPNQSASATHKCRFSRLHGLHGFLGLPLLSVVDVLLPLFGAGLSRPAISEFLPLGVGKRLILLLVANELAGLLTTGLLDLASYVYEGCIEERRLPPMRLDMDDLLPRRRGWEGELTDSVC